MRFINQLPPSISYLFWIDYQLVVTLPSAHQSVNLVLMHIGSSHKTKIYYHCMAELWKWQMTHLWWDLWLLSLLSTILQLYKALFGFHQALKWQHLPCSYTNWRSMRGLNRLWKIISHFLCTLLLSHQLVLYRFSMGSSHYLLLSCMARIHITLR